MTGDIGLRISLLGEIIISIDGDLVADVATRKAEALLIYLVCNPRPHRREVLSELLWNDRSPDRALSNLRLVLTQLRPRFAQFLNITRYTVAIRGDIQYWLDSDVFKRGLASDAATAAEALDLYRGNFLQGFYVRDADGFSEWQQSQAEHWRREAADGMRKLIEHHTVRSNYVQGLAWSKRLLAIDPFDEAAHRQTMLLLMRSGQRRVAALQYQHCTEILRAEIGCEPEAATTALYQRILAGSEQRPHTLPPQRGLLIGRAAESTRVYEWLTTPATRMLTIVGPGGGGKTTLALNVGWRVVTEFLGPCSDGVFYVALVGDNANLRVSDHELLMAVVQTLNLQLSARLPLAEQLGRYLCERELLLIIDNGELLAQSARRALISLLHQSQALRILVASRERLRLGDEQVIELDGLAYPEPHPPAEKRAVPQPLAQYAAVQLLLHHVSRSQGPMSVASYSTGDQRALAQICQMVHGLPLAIELAAPWLALRSPQELAQSIAETIDILQIDTPDLPERHRSIRAVFEYSWRLLPEPEAQILAGLSVFPSSFTADAAKMIAGANLTALAALHNKSLIQVLRLEPETRYALHPLLQRFAFEKLQADRQAEAAGRTRHAHYFAAFAQKRERLLYGPDSATAISDLEREFDNLRMGWHWAAAIEDIPTLSLYSIPLHDFCALHGWRLESRQLFGSGAVAARAWAKNATADRMTMLAAVRVLSCYAELEQTLGNTTAAEQAYHDCRVMLHAIAAEDVPELLFVYKQIGLLAYGRGVYREAMQCLRLTLAIAEEGDDTVRVADTLLSIGAVAIAQGDRAIAEQVLRRGLDIYDKMQYDWGRSHTLRFLGVIALSADDLAAARLYLHDSLTTAKKINNRVGEALALDQIGMLHLAEGQLDKSAATLRRALKLFEELGVELGVGKTLSHLARLALVQGRPDLASQQLLQAMVLAERIQSPPLLIDCAAIALHQLFSGDRSASPSPELTLLAEALSQHPACTAETRRQLVTLTTPHLRAIDDRSRLQNRTLEEIVSAIQSQLTNIGYTRAVSG